MHDMIDQVQSDKIRPHTFHIPVMGIGFTADTPLKVARYGISSVISLVDDVLLEQLRCYHCEREGEPYTEIKNGDEDARARRITAYLNLLDRLIERDTEALRMSPFEPGSEITRYFELLPDSPRKSLYHRMLGTDDAEQRVEMQTELRLMVERGRIDVNIMTKIDRASDNKGDPRPTELSDALSALRGVANSDIETCLVLSAGLNMRLFGYLSSLDAFYPDEQGRLKKQIVLKVSDFRSAMIQSKFLGRNGLWVSEFRIESSLNCGGHAFVTEGHLLGPILEDFKNSRQTILGKVRPTYEKALKSRGIAVSDNLPEQRVTVQGGIGTPDEDRFMLDRYGVDGTGWATPFLLVPEVTNVDKVHLEKLAKAQSGDVYLSDSSPLGVPFWMLRNSDSERRRMNRIEEGRPGSGCKKGYLVNNTEFSKKALCAASAAFQKKKLNQIEASGISGKELRFAQFKVLEKACICDDLSGGAMLKLEIDPTAKTTVCCGPNIVNFSRVVTLEEMVGHIYGRLSITDTPDRPHMFVREIGLYFDELEKQLNEYSAGISSCCDGYFDKFKKNMDKGIDYYRSIADELPAQDRASFNEKLDDYEKKLTALQIKEPASFNFATVPPSSVADSSLPV